MIAYLVFLEFLGIPVCLVFQAFLVSRDKILVLRVQQLLQGHSPIQFRLVYCQACFQGLVPHSPWESTTDSTESQRHDDGGGVTHPYSNQIQ